MRTHSDAVQSMYLHSHTILYLVRGGVNRPPRFPNYILPSDIQKKTITTGF